MGKNTITSSYDLREREPVHAKSRAEIRADHKCPFCSENKKNTQKVADATLKTLNRSCSLPNLNEYDLTPLDDSFSTDFSNLDLRGFNDSNFSLLEENLNNSSLSDYQDGNDNNFEVLSNLNNSSLSDYQEVNDSNFSALTNLNNSNLSDYEEIIIIENNLLNQTNPETADPVRSSTRKIAPYDGNPNFLCKCYRGVVKQKISHMLKYHEYHGLGTRSITRE